MKGFDKRFADVEDYIIKITAEIWEGRGFDKIKDYYGADCPVHLPTGDISGLPTIIQGTKDMLSIFPDRRLLPHAVIVSADEEGVIDMESGGDGQASYFSSHRIASVMHHSGKIDGGLPYGEPTNNRIIVFTIADCALRNNQVYHEWLVRDQLAIVQQIGLDPWDFVAKLNPQRPTKESVIHRPAEPKDLLAADNTSLFKPLPQKLSKENEEQLINYLAANKSLRSGKVSNSAVEIYHEAASILTPGNQHDYGKQAAAKFFEDYASSLANISFSVEQLTINVKADGGLTLAQRWSLKGEYAGGDRFVSYTDDETQKAKNLVKNQPIHIIGITHSDLEDGEIVREWNLIDELAVISQIIHPKS